MIKVIYDHHIFALQKFGGVSRYFYELSKRVDADPEFCAEIFAPLYLNQYLAEVRDMVKGQYLPYFPKTGVFYRKYNDLVSKIYLNNCKNYILHETYYRKSALAHSDCPTIITVHDMIFEKFPTMFSNHKFIIKQKNSAVNRANHVICVSENTRCDLIDIYNISPQKISVIHHGCSFFVDSNSSVSIHPIINRPYILYVGDRKRYKNFNRLLEAFATSNLLLSNFLLVVFGGGSLTHYEKMKISELGLTENNIFQVVGNDSILANLYRYATAFVYPSLYEGFGLPLLEAMSFNCPVICSNTSSFPEIAKNAAQYFNPLSIEEIKVAIEKVVQSDSLKKELVSRGKDRIQNFSWDKCAEETMKVYQRLSN